MSKKSKTQLSKAELAEVQELDKAIEELDEVHLADMSRSEIEKVVRSFSTEGLELRARRKKVRYRLYRCRTEAEGMAPSEADDEFKAKFESQPYFNGWRFFGEQWDVAFDDPYRIVHRDLSEQEEWEELVRAKFPTIIDGRVVYPDINVRRKVEAEAAKRTE